MKLFNRRVAITGLAAVAGFRALATTVQALSDTPSP
jgi:hypothetical protein